MNKYILILSLSLLFLVGFSIYQYLTFNDHKLHVIFCDVGQGDAVLIKTPSHKVILYDSGPGTRVLDCLGRHLPFWARTIDLAILSHPHSDHFQGYLGILKSYKIKSFAKEDLNNTAETYQELITKLHEKGIQVQNLEKGDSFSIKDGVKLQVIWPSKEYISVTSPKDYIGETREFGNVVILLSYKDFKALLTGDSQAVGLEQALREYSGQAVRSSNISVLEVPHHGSKTGLNQAILDIVKPGFAVFSVGAKNKYGHPAPSTISLLEKNGIPFEMTKDRGDIEIVK